MRSIKYIVFIATLFTGVLGCKDFEELEQNPNRATSAPASLILNGVLTNIYEGPWSLEHRQNQYWACNYNYYGTNEYWSSATLNFMTLKNIMKMEEEAERLGIGETNVYATLGKFLKAHFYVRMTQRVGDLPLTTALKGLEDTAPTYDTQKEIYVQVLQWLDEANAELAQLIAANDRHLAGDFYFNNDLTKWQKTVNTLKLRVLISLSKKENDPDLRIKDRFKEVLEQPVTFPLMESLDDNLQLVYNGTSNLYPTNPGNKGFDKGRYNMAATLIGNLTTL